MYLSFRARFLLSDGHAASLTKISCVAMFLAGAFSASSAVAQDGPTSRLVSCGQESCLRIEGRRDDAAATVAINGQAVAVTGSQNWSVTLPLATVRQIASEGARSLEVTLRHPATREETRDFAWLPIGLLGDTTELAAIRVTAS